MKKNIIIGADIVPTKNNLNAFKEGDITAILDYKLINIFKTADYAILNLETPITDKVTPIKKCGPNLIAPSAVINGIKKINPYFYTLANNHIMDQGEQGLHSTINLLKKHEIDYAGVGNNINDLKKFFIKDLDGFKIGIYCCAEHEFSIADTYNSGANPYDPLQTFDDIRKLNKECDYLIVLYHGGKELYQYPSPNLRKIFRKFASCGANLVIAQHTHCIGCREIFNGSELVYGQGNFLFNNSEHPLWMKSLLLSLTLDDNKITIDYIPIERKGDFVVLASEQNAKVILDGFYNRSNEILIDTFVENSYREFAASLKNNYLCAFMGRIGSVIYRINNKLQPILFNCIFRNKNYNTMINYLECESHHEILKEILNILK